MTRAHLYPGGITTTSRPIQLAILQILQIHSLSSCTRVTPSLRRYLFPLCLCQVEEKQSRLEGIAVPGPPPSQPPPPPSSWGLVPIRNDEDSADLTKSFQELSRCLPVLVNSGLLIKELIRASELSRKSSFPSSFSLSSLEKCVTCIRFLPTYFSVFLFCFLSRFSCRFDRRLKNALKHDGHTSMEEIHGSGMSSATLSSVLLLLLFGRATNAQKSLEFFDLLPEDPKLYDKMRPPKKDGQPTVVYFHVTVMGLDSIDENSMTYAADIFFAQTWKDNRLRLPENMTSEYRLLEVDWLKNMWRPDSFFKNAKSVTFQTMTIPNHYLWLYKDKTILYMVKLTLKLSCAMNFLIYPHDTQECKLQMESLSHTTDEMIFQWDPDVPLVVDENIELPQLQLVKNYTADCTQVYSTGNFTCLEVVFVLKRRLGYYLFHTYVPTCLIVIMSWVSFWIKPEAAPARVTLGVTSLLTLSTQHAKSQASLPPVSYLKAVDAFMSVCTVFVFMALMEYCLVNIVLGDSDTPSAKPTPPPPPPSSSTADSSKLDKIFDIAAKENAMLLSCRSQKSPAGPPPGPTPAQRARIRALNIDRFSRFFFPFLFAVLNVTYWIMFAEYI